MLKSVTKRVVKRSAAALGALALTLSPLTATPAQAQPASPVITWESCPFYVDAKGAKCGRILVPMHYDNPKAGDISVGFVKIPAQNPGARRGALFGNPGGPGGDAYSFFGMNEGMQWPQEIRNEWDLIAVQPRGLIGSTQLKCADPALNGPADIAKLSWDATVTQGALTRDLCEKPRPGYTKTITTYNNARDWDMVRWALGYDTISIMGLSYGTYLGSAYASMFPNRTDKVVLDSAMNPNDQWSKILLDQKGGYERALNEYFAWVAANDAKYRMGNTPLKAYQYWSNVVVAQSGTNPTVTPPPARVGDLPPALAFAGQAGADAMSAAGKARVEGEGIISRMLNPGANQVSSPLLLATRNVLPSPADWDSLARLTNGSLKQDQAKPAPELMKFLQEESIARNELLAVQTCNENIAAPDYGLIPAAMWANQTGEVITAPALQFGSGVTCNGAAPVTGKVALNGSKLKTRPLQINATRDPQTMYAGRFGIAQPMGSHVVTVHGPGHGHVGRGNQAVDRQVVEYLRTGNLGPVDQPGYFNQG